MERAQSYDWPGNVRELQNVVERAVILSGGGPLALDLPVASGVAADAVTVPSGDVIPETDWRRRERENVLLALRQTDFKISGKGGAAELLGINPGTLSSRMKVLGIDREAYRAASVTERTHS